MHRRPYFLKIAGESAAKIAAFDWAATPLGPVDQWPEELRTTVALMLASSFPKAIVWGPQRITLHNDAFLPILGRKGSGIGRAFDEIWSEIWEDIRPIWEKAMGGEATFIEDFKLRIERNGYPEDAYFTFCYGPIFGHDGRVLGMMDTVVETSKTVAAMQRVEVANAELNHRMRNVITMIGSMARQTLRGPEIAAQAAVFQERLGALAEAQMLLAVGEEYATTIGDLVHKIARSRLPSLEMVTIGGPQIAIGSHQATSLALALNELLTNAIKYGALSGDDGRVSILWDDENGDFTFNWREVGGRSVSQPVRTGFGSTLLTRVVPAAFHGTAILSYPETGVEYALATRRAALS